MAPNSLTGRRHERAIIVVEDAQALAQGAARRLISRLCGNRPAYAVCLSGGSGPLGLYGQLLNEPCRSAIPWARVHWFIGDERFVPIDHPLSNMGAARRAFLDEVAPPGNVHPIDTTLESPAAAASSYERVLRDFHGTDRIAPRPLFDLVLMGLGEDGHTASLFPGTASLDERERWVVGVDRAGHEPFVPRVTLTLPALAATREMLFLVAGAAKRNVMARVLAGCDLPASRAYSHGALVWLVDRAADPGSGDGS